MSFRLHVIISLYDYCRHEIEMPTYFRWLWCVKVLLPLFVWSALGNFPSVEYDALEQFYIETGGRNWTWLLPYSQYGSPWSFSNPQVDPCAESWQGIKCIGNCAFSNCSVAGISLNNYNLRNRLPPSLSNLTNLVSLSLSNNFLTGPIPNDFQHLSHLSVLNLNGNFLGGTFPSFLANSPNLVELQLYENELNGSLPESWLSTSKLESLYLNDNQFTGPIPPQIFSISSLQDFAASSNFFSESLSDDFFNASNLNQFVISSNLLTGTLPKWLFESVSLSFCEFFENSFHGPLPDNIPIDSSLIVIQGYSNFFSGSLPSSLINAKGLFQLYFSNNQLSNRLSEDLIFNSVLSVVVIESNYFSGSLPQNFGAWPSIFSFYAGSNHFNGTFPVTFLNTSSLANLGLYSNHLSGKISYLSFETLQNTASSIALYDNLLTGSIPASIGALNNLYSLLLFDNYLTGTIPLEVCSLNLLTQISVAGNHLHGNVSLILPHMRAALQIDLSANMFTGELVYPLDGATVLSSLDLLDLGWNLISGTLPVRMNAIPIRLLFINSNRLYGSVPSSLAEIPTLQYLNLTSNYFSGSIEGFINPVGALGFVALSNNYFGGTINNVFNRLRNLFVLSVHTNFFSGPISSLINPTLQKSIMKVDVSSNALTGTIPSSFFEVDDFQSLVCASNCLVGSIPTEACSAMNLTSLVLDGLHSSLACNKKIFPWVASSVYSLGVHSHLSSIPSCLFSLPKLTLLHVSGNAVSGSLPNELNISKSLNTLDLSHNAITGTIPSSIFDHYFDNLDLSFNQFSGTVPEEATLSAFNVSGTDTTSYTSLSLQVNRLSGTLPTSVLGLPSVNILEGNMFSCRSNHADLPENDPKYESYECGSENTDKLLFMWVGVVCGILLIVTIIGQYTFGVSVYDLFDAFQRTRFFISSSALNHILSEDSDGRAGLETFLKTRETVNPMTSSFPSTASTSPSPTTVNHLFLFFSENQLFRKFLIFIAGYSLIVLSTTYASLKVNFGTFTYQYAWVLSFSFLKGKTPTAVLLVFFFILVVSTHTIVAMHRAVKQRQLQQQQQQQAWSLRATQYSSMMLPHKWTKRYPIVVLLALVNCVIVFVVNGAYVYAVSQNLDRRALEFISFLIGFFKLMWNNVIVLGFIERSTESLLTPTRQSLFLVILAFFNNILAPYAAEAFVSSNCFEYSIVPPPSDTSTFTSEACFLYSPTLNPQNVTIVCGDFASEQYELALASFANAVTTVSFSPPFIYSYQCSSTLITVFASVFIIRYFLSGVVLPVFLAATKLLQLHFWHRYGAGSKAFRNITLLLPLMYRPVPVSISHIQPTALQNGAQSRSRPAKNDHHEGEISSSAPSSSKSTPTATSIAASTSTHTSTTVVDDIPHHNALMMFHLTNDEIFHNRPTRAALRKVFAVRMIGDVAVLLTFGLLFPPLAVVLVFSMSMEMLVLEFGMGYVASLAAEDLRPQSQLRQYLRWLNDSFAGFGDGIWKIFPVLSVICAWLWSFSFFDTLGNEEGGIQVVWVFPMVICFPLVTELCLLAIAKSYRRWFGSSFASSSARTSRADESAVHELGPQDKEIEMNSAV